MDVIDRYPVEIGAPDIAPHAAGNTGIPYVSTFEGAAPGPHVMVAAVIHGNELSGAHVVDFLLREGVRPLRGRLTLGFLNADACRNFDSDTPEATRWIDEDLNRVWEPDTLDGPRISTELARARQLRPLVDTVDFLLDLHSMQHPAEPLALSGPTAKGRRLAAAIGYPALVVADAGHAAGRRLRDYGEFADEASPRNALLVECGQHWAASSIDVAREVTLRFLRHFEVIGPGLAARFGVDAPPPPQRTIEVTQAVTVSADKFHFAAPYRGLEVIPKAGSVIGWDGQTPVRTPYDDCVLVMPSRRLVRGLTAVRLGRWVS